VPENLAYLKQEKETATTMEEQETKQEVLKFTEALRNAGISSVCVSYSGCGDEGQTEAPQCEGPDGKALELRIPSKGFDLDALGDLLGTFVPDGYANDEGGWGTISFDVQGGKIRVEHNWYETVSHAVDPREI
jgi:hypothetical protein